MGCRVGIEDGVDEKGWKGGEGGYHRAMICLCSLNVELRIVAGGRGGYGLKIYENRRSGRRAKKKNEITFIA